MLLKKIRQHVTKTPGIGLIPDAPDSRDFQFGIFSSGHEPKHQKHRVPTLSVKDQSGRNDCTFESSVAGKEPDEKIVLSVRGNVIWAREQGFISGDGFSTLRNSQKVLNKFGAVPEHLLPTKFSSWSDYSNSRYLTDKMRESAEKHKTQSYWKISSMDDVFKSLDDGRPVQSALQWHKGYNDPGEGGVLNYRSGVYVGGHAVLTVGYLIDGDQVLIEQQNSYRESYGVAGSFFMKVEDYIQELSRFGAYVNMDIPVNVARFVIDYDRQAVKSSDPADAHIWEIRSGRKYHVPSMKEFVKKFNSFHLVDPDLVDAVPKGQSYEEDCA